MEVNIMGTLGGLDVSYGAQTQIAKTNVMCVNVTTAGVTAGGAKHLLNSLQGLPVSIRPDFTFFYEETTATATAHHSGLTAAAQLTLFDSDPGNTGTTQSTSFDGHGVLRNIRETPVRPGSAYMNLAAGGGTDAGVVAGVAEGAAVVDLIPDPPAGDLAGSMRVLDVLSVGSMDISSTTAAVENDNLFTVVDAAAAAATDGGGSEALGVSGAMADLKNKTLRQEYENFMSASGGNGLALGGHNAGSGGCYTMDLSQLLLASKIEAATGATAATIDALTTTSTVGNGITAMGAGGTLVSVTTLCRSN
jgi:hypothetical protein